MVNFLKKVLYFPIAWYFRFFASIRLARWKPKIIVITGSNGKTTLLHLVDAQIGDKAKISHHANSSFGIPFDILGLHRKTLQKSEWVGFFLKAPFFAFKHPPSEKLYVVEADCDRPGEGKFLAEFLHPDIVLWVSTSQTHSMNFDHLVAGGKFSDVKEAIAYEYGYFLEYCREKAYINGDLSLEEKQIPRSKAEIVTITRDKLHKYEVTRDQTIFHIGKEKYSFNAILPEEVFYSVAMCNGLINDLKFSLDASYAKFVAPPGRGSIFSGIKNTLLVDSSYNANLSSMTAILSMFDKLHGKKKWAVIGDMLEQGKEEKEEHEKLAHLLEQYDFERLILMGPRVSKFTYPVLESKNKKWVLEKFIEPRPVLDYLIENIKGEEIILFKGARFLEGVIENLLEDKRDAAKLARREKIWDTRRKQWGL